MKIRLPRLLPALAFTTACGTSTTTIVENPVVEVRVSPENPTTSVGQSIQFTAEGLNASGGVVTGLPITWASSAPGNVSITNLGVATGLDVGQSMITATIGGISDTETLIVEANECTGRVDVVLAPGESSAYDGDECLLLPAGQAGDRYRVAITRPTLIADPADVPNVTLRIDPILTSAAAPIAVPPQLATRPEPRAFNPLPKIVDPRITRDLERLDATRRFHRELRERERALQSVAHLALPDRPSRAPGLTSHPDPPARADMYLELDCSATPLTRPVRLIDFDDGVAVYQDSVEWAASPLTTAATGQMLDHYAAYGAPMISDYFGDPSDIDGNGRLIVVTTASLPTGAAAAVYSGDFLSTAGCATSNEGEVVYFGQDIISDLVAAPNPSYLALGVLAHEVKHVVSIYNGVQRGGLFHDTWMEEGRAEIAQTMSSRIAWAATGGPAVGTAITGQMIQSAGQTAENWGVVVQAADIVRNLSSRPNSLVTDPDGADPSHSFYASSFHFHRYVGDEYGDAATAGADAALFSALAAQGAPIGSAGLEQQTQRTFQELLEEVVVATALHGEVASASPGFTTWDFKSVAEIFSSPDPDGQYPWPVTHSGGDDPGDPNAGFVSNSFSGPIGPSGMRFHDFLSGGVGVGAEILVTGAPTGRIIVTRLD